MENPFDEINRAMSQARDLDRAVSSQANSMAGLIRGKLRDVSPYHLEALKKELRDFNIHTGRWKD